MPKKNSVKEQINDKILDEISDCSLTPQEQDFVLFYLESNNATQSYLKAYGGEKRYAAVRGCNLLRKSTIKSEMKRLKKLMQIGYDIDPSKYLETLLKSANADIGDYIRFSEEEEPVMDGEGIPLVNPDTGEPITRKINRMHLADSSMVDTSIITEIKQGRDGISIKLVDKLKAWEKLKEFFEWKKQQDDVSTSSNNLLKVLDESSKKVWEDLDDSDMLKNGEV